MLKQLKKTRIIREFCGSIYDNYIEIPVAILNMGILKKYDSKGVKQFLYNGVQNEK